MVRLRIDPWQPEYGSAVEPDFAPDVAPEVAFDVEEGPWRPIAPPPHPSIPKHCTFIDGVRRIDTRLFAEEGSTVGYALAGSYAAGAVRAGHPPEVTHAEVGRLLALGAGLSYGDLTVVAGDSPLVYPQAIAHENTPSAPLQLLQNRMRQKEADLAREIFRSESPELMVLDGPLTYFNETGPVVGLIKRQQREYLEPPYLAILGQLKEAERTPVFRITGQQVERYSWYARLATGRAIDGSRTGIVRLEVRSEAGPAEAVRLADLTSAVLPGFASASFHDPRAPQNLYPVAQLEAVLKHRMGHPELIRRALETALWPVEEAAV